MALPKLVLLVEDDVDLGSILEETVRAAGYRAILAQSGAAALAQLGHERPDLVLLDWSMPDADPEELSEHFRAEGVPVVLASGSEHTRELANRIGASDVLEKPYDVDQLFRLIERYLGPPNEPAYS
jgi:DNA-binding response OmpR family regulator